MRALTLTISLVLFLMSAVQAQEAGTAANAAKPTPTALYVKFRVKQGKNADFEAAFRRMQHAMREKEPGALYYDLFVTPGDPQLYVIMERYKDAAAVAAHGQTEHMKQMLGDLKGLLDGRPEPQFLLLISAK